MGVPGKNSVRLVIQSVSGGSSPRYRLILYPEPAGFHSPLLLHSRADLLRRLRAAVPGFAETSLLTESGETQVIFAETLELSDAQLATLFAV